MSSRKFGRVLNFKKRGINGGAIRVEKGKKRGRKLGGMRERNEGHTGEKYAE